MFDHGIDASRQRMEARREAFIEALPADFKVREDGIAARSRSENASSKVKLGRIYQLVDEFSTHRASFVACKAGCAACCHMNVQISSIEAARIQAGTGRKAVSLQRSVRHGDAEFAGQACPFLVDNDCSIYEHRPFVCRNHASFDVDAYWCDPQRMQTITAPLIELGGVKEALLDLFKQDKQNVVADIRDFFSDVNRTP